MMSTTELICPQCGQAFPPEDEFCPVHGLTLVVRAPAQSATEQGPTPEPAPVVSAKTNDTAPIHAPALQTSHQPPESVEPSAEGPLTKLAKVLKLRGLRPRHPRKEADADITIDDANHRYTAPPESAGTPPPGGGQPSPLPQEVAAFGWKVCGLPLSLGGADQWLVTRDAQPDSVRGLFCMLRSGSLTQPALYQRLLNTSTTGHHRARLWQHGTSDRGHGIRADYELVSTTGKGVELSSWLRDSSPGEARALSLLPALHQLLQALHDEGLAPLVLEPGLLVRLSTGALALSRLWALTEAPVDNAPAVMRYRPEFQRTLLLPVPWAAPELSASQVESANAAVFSVGQLLACALWGQPATHQELRSGALPFHAIHHQGLARLMQLCLWHLPEGRTSWSQLRASLAAPEAVDQMPRPPAWASLMPGAASHAYTLAGASHWRLEDLLAAAVEPGHWDEAVRDIESILNWAEGTAWASTAELLLDVLRHGGHSPDWVLMQLARRVRPHAPITWRRLDLSSNHAAASLVALAQGALAGQPDELTLVQRLFEADLRGALLTETIHTGPH